MSYDELITRGESLSVETGGHLSSSGRSTELHSVDKAGFALWCADCAEFLDSTLAEDSPKRDLVTKLTELEPSVETKEYVLERLRELKKNGT